MNPHTSRIGFWSAVTATVFGLGYIIALLVTLSGILVGPWATFYQLAPSLVLAWSYMVLMACVLDFAALERRIWATIGFGFALMYSVMNSIVYFTELTVVIPRVLQNDAASLSVLLFEPGAFLFAVNGLAYGFMSMAALFAAPVFGRRGPEARVHWAMLAHGVIGPFIVGAVVWPPLTYIGALWIVTFPVMAILLAILFRRATVS
ncbi:MAG: hypothetical protein H3C34_16090 [Caldilineaceae bacterium]|nr:hypothetical protein [Caldilineaceae bacterium]